jgi:hypothetical protein
MSRDPQQQTSRLSRLRSTARTARDEWFGRRRHQLDLIDELALLSARLDALEAAERERARTERGG